MIDIPKWSINFRLEKSKEKSKLLIAKDSINCLVEFVDNLMNNYKITSSNVLSEFRNYFNKITSTFS